MQNGRDVAVGDVVSGAGVMSWDLNDLSQPQWCCDWAVGWVGLHWVVLEVFSNPNDSREEHDIFWLFWKWKPYLHSYRP